MTKAAEQVLEQAMRLEPSDRAELIGRLFEHDPLALEDGPEGPGDAEAWAAELRERRAEVERGEEIPVPWREAMARIRRSATNGE